VRERGLPASVRRRWATPLPRGNRPLRPPFAKGGRGDLLEGRAGIGDFLGQSRERTRKGSARGGIPPCAGNDETEQGEPFARNPLRGHRLPVRSSGCLDLRGYGFPRPRSSARVPPCRLVPVPTLCLPLCRLLRYATLPGLRPIAPPHEAPATQTCHQIVSRPSRPSMTSVMAQPVSPATRLDAGPGHLGGPPCSPTRVPRTPGSPGAARRSKRDRFRRNPDKPLDRTDTNCSQPASLTPRGPRARLACQCLILGFQGASFVLAVPSPGVAMSRALSPWTSGDPDAGSFASFWGHQLPIAMTASVCSESFM
jgi:hypothetical protein